MPPSNSIRLPSQLEFASYLQYSPRGQSAASKQARAICYALKNCGTLLVQGRPSRAVDLVANQLAKDIRAIPELAAIFGPDRVLIPIPRSAPTKLTGSLWPTREICDAFVRVGLGAEVVPALVRAISVQKSSTAGSARPGPIDHYNSTAVQIDSPFLTERKITLVDDVITRGATFMGMYPHVAQAFPTHEIACFAVVRTMSDGDVAGAIAPVSGVISANPYLQRRP